MAKKIEVRVVDGGSVLYDGTEYKEGDTLKVNPDEELAGVLLQNGHFIDVEEEKKQKAEQAAAEKEAKKAAKKLEKESGDGERE